MIAFIIKHKKLVAIMAIIMPLLLNLILSIPSPSWIFVVGDSSDWLLFWATYVTALASFAMVIATYETLLENKKQWVEAHSAHILVSAYQDRYHQVFIRIYNTSEIGVIIQSIHVCHEPSQSVKESFCIVKSTENSDNFTKWQHHYQHSYIVIRPYEYEDILLLQNFPRRFDERMDFTIKYNNTCTEVNFDLNDIVIIQNDYSVNKGNAN